MFRRRSGGPQQQTAILIAMQIVRLWRTKALVRSHIWNQTVLEFCRWYGGNSITNGDWLF
jgi:hypothetical protein